MPALVRRLLLLGLKNGPAGVTDPIYAAVMRFQFTTFLCYKKYDERRFNYCTIYNLRGTMPMMRPVFSRGYPKTVVRWVSVDGTIDLSWEAGRAPGLKWTEPGHGGLSFWSAISRDLWKWLQDASGHLGITYEQFVSFLSVRSPETGGIVVSDWLRRFETTRVAQIVKC